MEPLFGVNLTGTFVTAKASMESLISNGGKFTAIASDAGTNGAQGYSAYVAAKHGVVGLIRCLALDFGPAGVRGNVICPGLVETPMAQRLFAESSEGEVQFYKSSVPLGRFARPEENCGNCTAFCGVDVRQRHCLRRRWRRDGGVLRGNRAGPPNRPSPICLAAPPDAMNGSTGQQHDWMLHGRAASA